MARSVRFESKGAGHGVRLSARRSPSRQSQFPLLDKNAVQTMCTFSLNTLNAAGLPLLRGPVRAGCVPDELDRSMLRGMKRQCYTTRWDEVIRVTG